MSGELLSPASPSSSDPQQDLLRAAALQRQQEQYNQYVRAHRERTRGGGGGDGGPSSSRSSRSSSRSSSSTRSTRAHRDSQAASLYESQIGDLGDGAAEYHLSQEGQLAQHHQQSHGSSSTRASNWILTQVAWSDRTRIGSILMFIHILLYQSLAIAIIAIGRRHLHDTFYDPSSPSSSNTSHENTCAQLPLFLILAGVLFLVATVIVGAMITMAAAIARGSQPAKNALQCSGLPCLLLLILLSGIYFIWFIIGQVWLFSSSSGTFCEEELYRTGLFVVITSYVLAIVQTCIGCLRRCCQKDILPV